MGHEGHHHDHAHGHDGPAAAHRAASPARVSIFVVTCSDTREGATDLAGAEAVSAIERAGQTLVGRTLVREDPEKLVAALEQALSVGARAVVFTGGTGVSRRDVTIEAIRPRFDREMPGFGELFRALSFQEVGAAAWLSRASAGTCRGAAVFLLPGSPSAVKLALDRLILPELGHLVHELSR